MPSVTAYLSVHCSICNCVYYAAKEIAIICIPPPLIRVLARLAGEYAVIYYHHHCTTTIVIITIRALCIYARAGLRAVLEFELLFRVNRYI